MPPQENNPNPENIKMNIDFTKLAKIANKCKHHRVSRFLINYEQSIVKKIPFLLQINQCEFALKLAIESGDPNVIEKVFRTMLNCPVHSYGQPPKLNDKLVQDTISYAHDITGGLRHLRNFAKKKGHVQILQRIIERAEEAKQTMAKSKPTNPVERTKLNAMIAMQQDCTLPKMHIANSYSREKLPERFADLD